MVPRARDAPAELGAKMDGTLGIREKPHAFSRPTRHLVLGKRGYCAASSFPDTQFRLCLFWSNARLARKSGACKVEGHPPRDREASKPLQGALARIPSTPFIAVAYRARDQSPDK